MILNADPTRMAQIIGNLLTNAAKYTPQGGTIRLAVRKEGEEAMLSVSDNGLVRQLVDLHGGTVSAASEGAGKGSTSVVPMPLHHADIHVADTEPPGGNGVAAKTLRLLIADDNDDAARSLASLFKLYGHDLRIAHDGAQALEMAASFLPQVAFPDIGMLGLTGYKVARKLRMTEGLKDMTLVAVTGWGRKQTACAPGKPGSTTISRSLSFRRRSARCWSAWQVLAPDQAASKDEAGLLLVK